MDIHHRKLLILDKIINSYNNNSNSSEALEEKNKSDYCDDHECKDALNDYYLQTPLPPPVPPPPPPPSHHSSSILILMLCILGVAFALVSYFSIVRYRSRSSLRRSNSLATTNGVAEDFIDENHGPVVDHPIWYIRTIGLQQSVIDSISIVKYKKDEKLVEGSDCSVCLSEFQEDESLRLLPKCSHAFHIHCIDTWLRSHQNCPLCRASVVGEVNLNGGLVSVEEGEAERVVENRVEVENREVEEENATGENVSSLPNNDEENDGRRSRKDKGRVRSDFVQYNVKLDDEIEKVRRSISLNMYSASMAYLNIVGADKILVDGEGSSNSKDEGCSNVQPTEKMKQSSEIISKTASRNPSIYRLMKSSSLGRSLQKMPISMKRSFSTAGKSSLPTHSRSQLSSS